MKQRSPLAQAFGLLLLLAAATSPADAQDSLPKPRVDPAAALDALAPPAVPGPGRASDGLDVEVRRHRRLRIAGAVLLALYAPVATTTGVALYAVEGRCRGTCMFGHFPSLMAGSLMATPVLIAGATSLGIGRRRQRGLAYATPTISLSLHGVQLGFGATF